MADVIVDVECVDALTRPVDVLVLKHAQGLYGVDRAAVQALAIGPQLLPPVGEHLLVLGRPALAAGSVIFLGTRSIEKFTYADVREFGRRALSVAQRERPDAREVALTLHGVGFGLDETEAFDAEVAGVLDAVAAAEFPRGLEKIAFLERGERRAERLRTALGRLVPGGRIAAAGARVDARTTEHLRTVGFESDKGGHAFVAMPFDFAFEDVFYFGISGPIRDSGLLCERMDKQAFTGDVVGRMRQRINDAKFVVADMTGANPNVYLEVGYAWGRDVPTILLCQQTSELAFDVKGHRCLMYSSIRELERKLRDEIGLLLAQPRHP